MSKLPAASLFKIIFETKTSLRFLTGTIGSFAFSMAVILCTLGLMDGFVISLKKSLSYSNGDIKITSRSGFYNLSEKDINLVNKSENHLSASIFQIESFAVVDEISKGVLVKGVDPEKFQKVTGIDLSNLSSGIYIGSEFSKKYGLNIGDVITLVLPKNKSSDFENVVLREFEINGIVQHGIYEKDMRFVYINKSALAANLGYIDKVTNVTLVKTPYFSQIEENVELYKENLPSKFNVEPFWSESEVLIDAVEVEKYSISLVLQLIVIVSILNVVAFIIFISEIKSQEFFMLRALGVSIGLLQRFWFLLLILLWAISCCFSILLKSIFSYGIENLPFLKIPGDIYVLSELKIILDWQDYIYVFGVSLIWILLIGFITMVKLKGKSVIGGLREEFS